jgi:hypothetical protein
VARKLLAVLVVCFVGLFPACAKKERYGSIDTAAPSVQVKDVLLSESYGGKDVRMSGTIAMQCASSGCWFFLDDGTGRMLVDLKGLGLGLGPRSGKKAVVSGTVIVDPQGQALLSAKGLEVS